MWTYTIVDFQPMLDWCLQGDIVDPYGNTGTCVVVTSVVKLVPNDPFPYDWDGVLRY